MAEDERECRQALLAIDDLVVVVMGRPGAVNDESADVVVGSATPCVAHVGQQLDDLVVAPRVCTLVDGDDVASPSEDLADREDLDLRCHDMPLFASGPIAVLSSAKYGASWSS